MIAKLTSVSIEPVEEPNTMLARLTSLSIELVTRPFRGVPHAYFVDTY
jgi:hypothetical protein